MDVVKAASMTQAVRAVIGGMEDGEKFYGNQLKRAVVRIYPEAKDMYPDTMLRMMRRHCRKSVRCVDHNAGEYMKVDGPDLFGREESYED